MTSAHKEGIAIPLAHIMADPAAQPRTSISTEGAIMTSALPVLSDPVAWRAVERPWFLPGATALPRLHHQSQPGFFPFVIVGLERLQTRQKPAGDSA